MPSQSIVGLANEADVYGDTAQHGKSHDNIICTNEMEHKLADIETQTHCDESETSYDTSKGEDGGCS